MKIRQGFVSNSSSSSFIIAVDPQMITSGSIYVILNEEVFRGAGMIHEMYYGDLNTVNLADMFVSEVIDALKIPPIEREGEIVDEMSIKLQDYHVIDGFWDKHLKDGGIRREDKQEAYRKDCDAYENEVKDKARVILKRMREENPDKELAVISFSDQDGAYHSWLEHSGIVNKVFPGAVIVSHH